MLILKAGPAQYSIRPAHLSLLVTLRRRSLQMVSDLGYDFFQSKDVDKAVKIANELLIPCLSWFGCTIAPGDEGMLESVREKWCHCLNEPGLTSSEYNCITNAYKKSYR